MGRNRTSIRTNDLKQLGKLFAESEPVKPKYIPFIPIPCARCGRWVGYFAAVRSSGDGWCGFTHPQPCDPTIMAEYQRRILNRNALLRGGDPDDLYSAL